MLCLGEKRVRAHRKGEACGGRWIQRKETQAARGDGEVNGGCSREILTVRAGGEREKMKTWSRISKKKNNPARRRQ